MDIKLFSSDICPRCKVLKMKLDESKIKYENITGEEAINAGINEIPVLEVDGRRMNFSESIQWIKERNKNAN